MRDATPCHTMPRRHVSPVLLIADAFDYAAAYAAAIDAAATARPRHCSPMLLLMPLTCFRYAYLPVTEFTFRYFACLAVIFYMLPAPPLFRHHAASLRFLLIVSCRHVAAFFATFAADADFLSSTLLIRFRYCRQLFLIFTTPAIFAADFRHARRLLSPLFAFARHYTDTIDLRSPGFCCHFSLRCPLLATLFSYARFSSRERNIATRVYFFVTGCCCCSRCYAFIIYLVARYAPC